MAKNKNKLNTKKLNNTPETKLGKKKEEPVNSENSEIVIQDVENDISEINSNDDSKSEENEEQGILQDDEVAEEEEEEEEEEEGLVPVEELEELSTADSDEEPLIHEDAIPVQKVTKNNKEGLERVLEEIAIKNLPWIETQAITSNESIVVEDIHNDLERELAFYNQALAAAIEAKKKCEQIGVPFSRPDDYFAEMVKSDEHMNKIRQKILDETQKIKSSEMAKKQRELKKFGKQIQIEKIKERHLHKRQELEKIKTIKRKIKDTDNDGFDIDLEDESQNHSKKKSGTINHKRQTKNQKYGFGGKKRYAKSNTRESTNAENDGFNPKKNKKLFSGMNTKKGKSKRPGKSKRKAGK